jgi:hypothetical protein
MKTKWRENLTPPQIRFGQSVANTLNTLPKQGPLLPYLRGRLPGYRANEFRERCRGLGIQGVSLHSYRYAWAERAKTAGYPERFAQLALGHNSKAVHRAYARAARVTLPPLENYEKGAAAAPVIPLPVSSTGDRPVFRRRTSPVAHPSRDIFTPVIFDPLWRGVARSDGVC